MISTRIKLHCVYALLYLFYVAYNFEGVAHEIYLLFTVVYNLDRVLADGVTELFGYHERFKVERPSVNCTQREYCLRRVVPEYFDSAL